MVDLMNVILFLECTFDQRRFKCENCGMRYKHKASLKRHKDACGNLKKYGCPYCPHRSSRMDSIKQHIYYLHSDLEGQPRILN